MREIIIEIKSGFKINKLFFPTIVDYSYKKGFINNINTNEVTTYINTAFPTNFIPTTALKSDIMTILNNGETVKKEKTPVFDMPKSAKALAIG